MGRVGKTTMAKILDFCTINYMTIANTLPKDEICKKYKVTKNNKLCSFYENHTHDTIKPTRANLKTIILNQPGKFVNTIP